MKHIRKTGVSSPRQQFPGLHWLMILIGLALFGAVSAFVDLKPQVDENFFFSSSDPQFQQSAKIDKIFPTSSQLLISITGRISSEPYLGRLAQLTRQIQLIETVSNVESLTAGPKDFEDAEKSPFWRRLLIADNGRSSNVVIFASNRDPQLLISGIESAMAKFDAQGFRPKLAGAPYVAEMIRRSLRHDFHTFSLTSVLLFGAAMWLLFSSFKLTLGMVVTCTSSVLANLLLQSLLGQKIGILTVNLGAIVFVIAMSHLVYMTFNWQTLAAKEDASDLSSKAWRMTFRVLLVYDVCDAWLRQSAAGTGKAAAGTGNWWPDRNDHCADLFLSHVPCISPLGRSGENQKGGGNREIVFARQEVRLGIPDHRFGQRRTRLWPDAPEYRSEPS